MRAYAVRNIARRPAEWLGGFGFYRNSNCERPRTTTTIVRIIGKANTPPCVIGVICLFIYFHFTQFKTIINKPIENNIAFGERIRTWQKKKENFILFRKEKRNGNLSQCGGDDGDDDDDVDDFSGGFSPWSSNALWVCCQFIWLYGTEENKNQPAFRHNHGKLRYFNVFNAHITHDR